MIFKEISYNNVRYNRAVYWNQKNKIEKERLSQLVNQRKKDKYKISKERQTHYKAQRLLDKL